MAMRIKLLCSCFSFSIVLNRDGLLHLLSAANRAGRRFVRSRNAKYQSLSRASNPSRSAGRHSISEHLHVLYENSIVYGDICMYYRISIFQKTAISILDSDVGYIACLLPLRSRIAPQWRAHVSPLFA
jgi:hypothetical protein